MSMQKMNILMQILGKVLNQSIFLWCYCKKEEKIGQVCYLFPLII